MVSVDKSYTLGPRKHNPSVTYHSGQPPFGSSVPGSVVPVLLYYNSALVSVDTSSRLGPRKHSISVT